MKIKQIKTSASTEILLETVEKNKLKTAFILSNDFLQAIIEGVVLALTYRFLTVLQAGQPLGKGQSWLEESIINFDGLATKEILICLLFLISLGVILQSILKYSSRIVGAKIAAEIKIKLLYDISRIINNTNYLLLQSMRTGNMITVCVESPEAIRQQFELYLSLFVALMYLLVYVFVLAAYSLNELVVAIIGILIVAVVQIYFSFKTKKWSISLSSNVSDANNTLAQLVGGFKFLKASSSVKLVINKLKLELIELKSSYIKTAYFSELTAPLGKALGMIVIVVIAIMFINSSNDYEQVLPSLAIFIVTLQRLIGKANEVFSLLRDFAQNRGRLVLYNRFISEFSAKSFPSLNYIESKPRATTPNISQSKDKIIDHVKALQINQLSFRYPSANIDTLSGLSIGFDAGDFVGIVGESGSGKSTFLDILTGLLSPDSGNIRFNGRSIYESFAPERSLKENLFLVDQDALVFHGTILENIVWTSITNDEDKVWECLRCVNMESYVLSLTEGLETVIGEGGIKMSGGQSQRLCIARAIYQDKQILILDEATSRLDKQNEAEILERIRKSRNSKITIMVTHNLDNLVYTTRCLCFDRGVIASVGNFHTVTSYISLNNLSKL